MTSIIVSCIRTQCYGFNLLDFLIASGTIQCTLMAVRLCSSAPCNPANCTSFNSTYLQVETLSSEDGSLDGHFWTTPLLLRSLVWNLAHTMYVLSWCQGLYCTFQYNFQASPTSSKLVQDFLWCRSSWVVMCFWVSFQHTTIDCIYTSVGVKLSERLVVTSIRDEIIWLLCSGLSRHLSYLIFDSWLLGDNSSALSRFDIATR